MNDAGHPTLITPAPSQQPARRGGGLALALAQVILWGFNKHYRLFRETTQEAKQRFARRRLIFERLRPEELDRATNPEEPENVGRFPEATH